MRKIDYSILAETIKKHGVDNLSIPYHWPNENQAIGARECAEKIARTFAHFAHVDKIEFLKACGIENR